MSSQVSVFLVDFFYKPIKQFSANTVEELYEILMKELKLTNIAPNVYEHDEELILLKNSKYIAINPYYEGLYKERTLLFSTSLEDLDEQHTEASIAF